VGAVVGGKHTEREVPPSTGAAIGVHFRVGSPASEAAQSEAAVQGLLQTPAPATVTQ
jgi:hypothetical protein